MANVTDQVQEQSTILRHFVLQDPRPKQIVALEYIERKYREGFRHIVVAAPTGLGKSGLASTTCFWAQDLVADGFDNGGYVLVNQKLLQDQYEHDFKHYVVADPLRRCQSIKSATEYACMAHGNCAFGLRSKPPCPSLKTQSCNYMRQKNAWMRAMLSVTNYSYLMVEHSASGKLLPRKVLCLDECHGLERTILKFVEVSLSQQGLQQWTPSIKQVPDFENVQQFADFLLDEYLPILYKRVESLAGWEPSDDSAKDKKIAQEKVDLENHYSRTLRGAKLILDDPDNWIFWQEDDDKGEHWAIAKPLDASPFGQDLIFGMGHLCIHLSAYPGSKKVYCQSLGLDPAQVAWLNLNSTFPVEHRPVFLSMVGSMSRNNRAETLPKMIDFIKVIMESYPDTKGLLHVGSYEIGKAIYDGLRKLGQGDRLAFPESADARDPAFLRHKNAKHGSVIISPSMMEGFDFKDELCRWQVIAKVPFLYLGDPQVKAKQEINPQWYDAQALSSIVQAVGRGCRSETDFCDTYLLDSDFIALYERAGDMLPPWFAESLVWPKRK